MNTSVSCQIEECGVPPLPEYTIIFGNLYNVGANVCYECQNGYINTGGNTNCSVCSGIGDCTTVDITCSAPTTTPEPTTTTTTMTTTTTTTTTPPVACDNNWIEYEGHCYFRVATGKKWSAARTNCRNLGGYLLEIETAAENTFISNTFPSNDYWIGGNDMAQEGKFVWDSGNALTFKWWRSGEPNGGTGENCIRIDTDTKWRNKGCSIYLNSICEK